MKSKRPWYRSLAAIGIVGLVFQLLAPFGVDISRAAATASATNIVADGITASSANVSVYISGGGYFKVEYGTTASYGSFSSQQYITSTPWGPVGTTLTGLSPSTTYNYRVKAWPLSTPSETDATVKADITYSSNYTFTTTSAPDTTPPSAPGNMAVSDITSTHVSLSWSIPSDNVGVTRYELKYKIGSGAFTESDWVSASSLSAPAGPLTSGGGTTTFGINELTANTAYVLGLKAYDAAGNGSPLAVSPSFTTLPPPDTITPSITGVSASGVTAVSANINFTLSEVATVKVEYGQSGALTLSTAEASFPTTPMNIMLSGLTANITYSYRVMARDAVGNIGYSTTSTFTTTSGAATGAPTVSGTHVMIAGGTTTQLMWGCDQQCYGQVEYSTSPTYGGGFFTPWTTTLSSSPMVDLTGLTANTTYYTRVYAKNSSGVVSSGTAFSFTTSSGGTTTDTTPPAISAVAASGVTASSASIAFTLNESGYGKIEYGIGGNYGSVSSELAAGANVPTTISLSGLNSGTTYNYRVVGRDSANNSATSGTYSFTTTSSASTPGAGAPEPSTNDAGVWAQVDTATGQLAGSAICTRSVCGLNGDWHGYVPPPSYATGSVWWPTSKRYIWQMQGQAGYGSGTFNFSTYVFTVSGGTIYNGVFTPTSASSSSSLIGYWKFDGNGNNEVAGGTSAVTVGGASYRTSGGASAGYAYIPTGSDYLRIPYSSAFDLPTSFTVEFWFRQRADRNFFQDLVYKGTPTNNYNFRVFRQLWNQYNYGPIITGYTAQNTGYWSQTSNSNQLSHNTWHHVAYTKDSTGSAYYLDGTLTHRLDTTQYTEYSGSAKTPAVDIIIGDSAVDTDIDNLKIYNRALSVSEVSQSYGSLSGSSTGGDTTAPTLSGIWSSGVTANSANVYFTLNEAGYAKVEYGPNNTFNLSTSELSVPASVSSSIYLSGLSSGTTYSYRIAARDSANNSAASASYSFATTFGSTIATTTPPIGNTLPSGSSSLRVTVKDYNGAIVSGANVGLNMASGSGWSNGYTGADGSYTFSGIASGSYNIGVSSPSNRTDLGYIASFPVTLTAGVASNQEVSLPRSTTWPTATSTPSTTGTAGVRITVKDTTGAIVSGANVSISNASSGGYSWSSGYTGADGSFTATNLSAGSFNIGVSAPSSRTDLGYISSYPISLVSGTTITQEVTLPRSTTTTPTPTIDTTPPNISGVHIMDNTAARTQVMWGTDDQSLGKVEYGATTAYGNSTVWSTYVSYSPTVDITGLTIGKLYHYRVTAKNQVGLESTSPDYTFTAGSSTAPTPSTFAVDSGRSYPQPGMTDVPTAIGKIHIEFTKSVDPVSVTGGAVYLGFLGATNISSLSGTLDVFSNGLNFIPSSPLKAGATYNFTVRGTIRASTGESMAGDYSLSFTTAKDGAAVGAGTIKGTVKDGSGQGVSGAYVSLRSSSNTYYGGTSYAGASSGFGGFGYSQTAQTTTYGEYNFSNLAAGAYTLEAYPPSGGGGVDRPAPQSVTIAASETVVRDFVFGSSSKFIKGSVKFSDGSPVTDAEVSAYRREGSGWVSSPTGANGEYTLAIGSGSWMVSIRPRFTPVPYPVPYSSGTIAYLPPPPPPPPPTPNWVYTNPPQEVYIDTESKVIDFTVPRQSSSTSVSGTLERSDGEPISAGMATVRFIGQGGFSVSTAVPAGGRFSTPINPGGYKVYVDLTDSNLSSPDFPPISIGPGEQRDIGVIRLYSASASISGRVTAPDGKGIARVKVGGWKMNSSDNSSASTDEKGEYVLKVSSGEWTVGIMPTPDQPYSTTAPPQAVRVKGGRVSGINFVLAQSDGIVNGVVTDESGNILPDFYGFVRVGSKNGYRVPAGGPVERGQFTLRLPAGSYVLDMELPPNAAYGWPAPVPITVATGESVKVAMKMATSASGAVIGYLVDAAGNKITNAPFKVFASGEGGGWYSAITQPDIGYYKLKLPAGTWFIGYDLAGEDNSYERLGNRKKKVTVGAGEIVSLDLEVVRSSGKITGVIRDDEGKGVANVWIAIATSQFGTFSRATASSWRYLNGVNSDEKGNFALNVPPGVYFVRAFVPPSLDFINPEEQKVRVAAGEEEKVELVLRARETTISGKTTIAGIPNWAFVWAWSDTGGYTETAADDSGNYKLKVSSGDTWHVAAMAEIKRDTYKASEVELVVTRPGNYPLTLDLSPLGVKLPEPVTIAAQADQMTVAENPGGTKLVVPANAAGTEGALSVSITPQVTTPSQGADRVIGFGYEMEVRTPTGQKINTFNSELTVSIPYDPRELARLSITPGDLSLRFWDETSSTWQTVANAIVDETNHVVTGSVAHLTRFAIVAATDTEPPAAPTKVKAQVAGDGVVVTWQKPKDKDLKYVKVYRSAKSGALGEVVANNLTAATYKDSGMARGATYYYLVRAVDAAGNESINTAAVTVKIAAGAGLLGKKAVRGLAVAKEKQKLEGIITDINLAVSTLEIKNKAGKTVSISFSPTLTIEKDGKKALVSTLKAGNTITAEASRDNDVSTLVSAKASSVKVKIKGKVKGAETIGAKGKVSIRVSDVQGQVQGAAIKRGQETGAVINGGYLIENGRVVPVEHLLTQGDVVVEGVVEDGGITVTRITSGK